MRHTCIIIITVKLEITRPTHLDITIHPGFGGGSNHNGLTFDINAVNITRCQKLSPPKEYHCKATHKLFRSRNDVRSRRSNITRYTYIVGTRPGCILTLTFRSYTIILLVCEFCIHRARFQLCGQC